MTDTAARSTERSLRSACYHNGGVAISQEGERKGQEYSVHKSQTDVITTECIPCSSKHRVLSSGVGQFLSELG